MEYFSSTFKTIHKSEKIFKYDTNDIILVTDYIFYILTIKIKDEKFSLLPPQNICYSDLKNGQLAIFWGDEKAIRELNIITSFKYPVDIEEANIIGRKELGFSFSYWLNINFEDVDRHLKELKKIDNANIKSILDAQAAYNKITYLNPYTKKFVKKIVQDVHKQIKTRRGTMEFNPKFKAKNIVVKKNQAFYVLPFSEGPLNAYQAIKDGVSNEKIDCMIIKSEDRFDPSRGNNIIENIWQDICASHFIIADLSEKNPNVYYELGICDAIGKTVIPICSNKSLQNDYSDKLPFDISGGYTIFYDENYSGIEKLKKDVNQRIKAILTGSTVEIE